MISTIIFSRDRACQLDLLLRSIQQFAPVLAPVHVLYKATDEEYELGYSQVKFDHPFVSWKREGSFLNDFDDLLAADQNKLMMCMTDDSIFRGEFSDDGPVKKMLDKEHDAICFSLRLGENSRYCYPLRVTQNLPYFTRAPDDIRLWSWRYYKNDFSYPGSLDAHVFRRDLFVGLINGRPFSNPNTLEDALMAGCKETPQSVMGCFSKSLVVSIPANVVTETHQNRHAIGAKLYRTRPLNTRYLAGDRLLLEPLLTQPVRAAHVALKLEFQ